MDEMLCICKSDVSINTEIELLASNIVDKSYQTIKKEEIKKIIVKALNNEDSLIMKRYLLEVIKKIDWFNECEIDIFFSRFISEMLEQYGNNISVICKEKKTSSNLNIVYNYIRKGDFTEEKVIKYVYNKKESYLEEKDMSDEEVIIIFDDYVGSGNTVIDIINCIEKIYKEKQIIICVYIWQKKGLENIEKYIESNELKNCYSINYNSVVYQENYEEKFIDNEYILKYIENVCNCAKGYKYGYDNIGAMVVIDGIAPNNNISMIWYDNIIYNGRKWIPILNRDYNYQWIINQKEKILKTSHRDLQMLYNKFIYKNKYEYNEFVTLLQLFNLYSINIKRIKDLIGVDTVDEVECIIKKFEEDGIITYGLDNILEFKDKRLISQLKNFEEKLYYHKKRY